MEKTRVTLATVAEKAGVSAMTASRALRDSGDVSPKTRERIKSIAADLGYFGNSLAASFSAKNSPLVAVIMPSFSNTVFPEVLAGLSDSLTAQGLQPVFGLSDYDAKKEQELVQQLLGWNPAALVLPGLDQLPATRKMAIKAGLPVVQVMDLDGTPIQAAVGFSHFKAGFDMGCALIDRGFKSFGYVGAAHHRDVRSQKRYDGFVAALDQAGLVCQAEICDELSTMLVGSERTAVLLGRDPTIDCLYYGNDDLAAGGVFHCMAQGISLPDDVAIAGFNGLAIADALPVKIATSRSRRFEIGQQAGELVCQAVKGGASLIDRIIEVKPEIDLGDLAR